MRQQDFVFLLLSSSFVLNPFLFAHLSQFRYGTKTKNEKKTYTHTNTIGNQFELARWVTQNRSKLVMCLNSYRGMDFNWNVHFDQFKYSESDISFPTMYGSHIRFVCIYSLFAVRLVVFSHFFSPALSLSHTHALLLFHSFGLSWSCVLGLNRVSWIGVERSQRVDE